jgi:hypothetical protein
MARRHAQHVDLVRTHVDVLVGDEHFDDCFALPEHSLLVVLLRPRPPSPPVS